MSSRLRHANNHPLLKKSTSPLPLYDDKKRRRKVWFAAENWKYYALALACVACVAWLASPLDQHSHVKRVLARPRIIRSEENDTRLLLVLEKPRVINQQLAKQLMANVGKTPRMVDLPPAEGQLTKQMMVELYGWFNLPPVRNEIPEVYEVVLAALMQWPAFMSTPDQFIEFSSDYYLVKPHLLALPAHDCRIAVVSSFPPKHCGIAEFTKSLLAAMHSSNCLVDVIPLIELGTEQSYLTSLPDGIRIPALVPQSTHGIDSQAYLDLAHYIRLEDYDSVLVQQEFGLTRSMWQIWLLLKTVKSGDFDTASSMLVRERRELAKMAAVANWKSQYDWKRSKGLVSLKREWKRAMAPDAPVTIALAKVPRVAIIVHSPRAFPNPEERCLIYALTNYSDVVITLSKWGVESLASAYGVASEKLAFVPHGVESDKDELEMSAEMERFKTAPRGKRFFTLFANGLITTFKRYDRVIRAMPSIIAQMPSDLELRFIVLGQQCEGCKERGHVEAWKALAHQLGVHRHIVWMHRYASKHEIRNWLTNMADVYVATFDEITPVSGTLLQAMSHGVPILATWTRYAVEMLQGLPGKSWQPNTTRFMTTPMGVLVPFDDARAVADACLNLMRVDGKAMGRRAREKVEDWSWENVASSVAALALGDEQPTGPATETADDADFAYWSGETIRLFNGKKIRVQSIQQRITLGEHYAWAAKGKVLLHSGSYKVFVDARVEAEAYFYDLDQDGQPYVFDGENGLRMVDHLDGITIDEVELEHSRKYIRSSISIGNATVRMPGFHVECDARFGCEVFQDGPRPSDVSIRVVIEESDTESMKVIMTVGKIVVTIAQVIFTSRTDGVFHGLSIKTTVQDAFAHPIGMLGQSLRCNHDYSCRSRHMWRTRSCPVDCGFLYAGAPFEYEEYVSRAMHGEAFEVRLKERAEAMAYNAQMPKKSMWIPVPPELSRQPGPDLRDDDEVDAPWEFLWMLRTGTGSRGQSAHVQPRCNVFHG